MRAARLWPLVSEHAAWCLGWGAIAPMGEAAARQFDAGLLFVAGKLVAFPLHMHRLMMPALTEFVPALEPVTETVRSIYDGADGLLLYLLPIIFQFGWLVLPVLAGAAACLCVLPLVRRLLRTARNTSAGIETIGPVCSPRAWPAFAMGTASSALLVFLACLHVAVILAFVIGLGNAHSDSPASYDPAHMPDADFKGVAVDNMTRPEIFGVALLGSVMLGAPFLGGPFLAMFLRRRLMAAGRRLLAR